MLSCAPVTHIYIQPLPAPIALEGAGKRYRVYVTWKWLLDLTNASHNRFQQCTENFGYRDRGLNPNFIAAVSNSKKSPSKNNSREAERDTCMYVLLIITSADYDSFYGTIVSAILVHPSKINH